MPGDRGVYAQGDASWKDFFCRRRREEPQISFAWDEKLETCHRVSYAGVQSLAEDAKPSLVMAPSNRFRFFLSGFCSAGCY